MWDDLREQSLLRPTSWLGLIVWFGFDGKSRSLDLRIRSVERVCLDSRRG
jgi:hypothetical protein